MPDLGPHGAYVLASYIAAGLVLGFMITVSLLAWLGAKARLVALERIAGERGGRTR